MGLDRPDADLPEGRLAQHLRKQLAQIGRRGLGHGDGDVWRGCSALAKSCFCLLSATKNCDLIEFTGDRMEKCKLTLC